MAAPSKTSALPCDDFQKFQDTLRQLRLIDDRIIHALNDSLPTQSFRGKVDASSVCKRFYDELQIAYDQRKNAIQHCLEIASKEVDTLRQEKASNPDDFNTLKSLRKEQTKLRLMQQELSVEEVSKIEL
ncbi:coiled-coil domain-containing protein 58-like [Plakobranchus ocellatus]|uniref:Protein MIX23 n=1 Tax=Plakobranchus ocellatus TaxID=259542 RepID=A0AAV3XQ64_9GAST|nr:coiled-coil domain-containing protein 58-like [Plakobranchus ocellatus]